MVEQLRMDLCGKSDKQNSQDVCVLQNFKFIDLFAGIGGFHQALSNLGCKCVLASEIDEWAIKSYKENYGIDAANDVTKIKSEDIPEFDVLCGGFPCQAFSKAGSQKGFKDETKGTLFFEIARILEARKPKFILLENVRNLVSHDKGNTWRVIRTTLEDLGYVLADNPIIMSPHQLGVPQLRERVYILGIHKSLGVKHLNFNLPNMDKNTINLYETGILEEKVDEKYNISPDEERLLECWDEFIKA